MHHDRRDSPPFEATSGNDSPVEATFVPHRYEPNYAYPLLVLLHGRGGDERQLVDAMPRMSWRNYVGLGLRGPELVRRDDRVVGYDWGPAFRHPRRRPVADRPEPDRARSIVDALRRGGSDRIDAIEDAVFSAVLRTRRALHVHSERIFLVGSGEGAAVAYRLGLTYPERFAGVVAINGWIPRGFLPLGRWRACRGLRVLALNGFGSARAPLADAERDVALLRSAGLPATLRTYFPGGRITRAMLSDADTWLIDRCVADCP